MTCPCPDSENNDTKNNNNHIDGTKYSNNNSVTPDMGNKTRRRLSRSLVSLTNLIELPYRFQTWNYILLTAKRHKYIEKCNHFPFNHHVIK